MNGRYSNASRERAKDNARFHYGLGAPFYGLWLDEPRMMYTCDYWKDGTTTLEQAQANKNEHVCRKARLAPGEEVVDVGCGFGGFMFDAAERHGARVTGVNATTEQVDWLPRPTARNRIWAAFIDKELGNEAVSYVLESGAEGALHIDHVLEYNEDPRLSSELLTHQLTVEARKRIAGARPSRREIVRRMRTSLPQLYRLLDPANAKKSMNQLVALLHVLGCDVDVTVKRKSKAA